MQEVDDFLFGNIMALSVQVNDEDAYDFLNQFTSFKKDVFFMVDDGCKYKIDKNKKTVKIVHRKYKDEDSDDLNNILSFVKDDLECAWTLKVLSKSGYKIFFENKYSN